MKGGIHIGLFLMSLLLSVVLFLVVYAQEHPSGLERTLTLKLRADGLDTTKFVLTSAPTLFKAKVRCSDKELEMMHEDESLEAVVDLSAPQVGLHSYAVHFSPDHYRPYFDYTNQTANVELDEVASGSKSVTWATRGSLSDQTYVLENAIADPSIVRFTGASKEVAKVSQARALLDLGGIDPRSLREQSVPIELLDPKGFPLTRLQVDPPFVKLKLVVNPAPQERQVFVLPNIQGRPALGYLVVGYESDPVQVRVRGRSEVLAGLSQLATEPIDIEGLSRSRTFTTQLAVPDGIQRVSSRRVRVTVVIRQIPRIDNPGPTGAGARNP